MMGNLKIQPVAILGPDGRHCFRRAQIVDYIGRYVNIIGLCQISNSRACSVLLDGSDPETYVSIPMTLTLFSIKRNPFSIRRKAGVCFLTKGRIYFSKLAPLC